VAPQHGDIAESGFAIDTNKYQMQSLSPSVLQRIASGEAAAVRECIDEYGAWYGALARRLSRTPSDAEDATQEIFLDIWRSAAVSTRRAGLRQGVHRDDRPSPVDRPAA
jgi:hypothetical protein